MKRSWLRRRRATPRKSGRVRDVEYMLDVKKLPCAARGLSPCASTRIEADHQGPRPFGRKADDDTCVPMCADGWGNGHHPERTDGRGAFEGWSKERMRAWCDERIAETRAAVLEMRLRGDGEVIPW